MKAATCDAPPPKLLSGVVRMMEAEAVVEKAV